MLESTRSTKHGDTSGKTTSCTEKVLHHHQEEGEENDQLFFERMVDNKVFLPNLIQTIAPVPRELSLQLALAVLPNILLGKLKLHIITFLMH